MSDSHFAPYFPSAQLYQSAKADDSAFGLDELDYAKQPFDFFQFGHGSSGILAPHPDQFESELDSSLAAFDAELNHIPLETGTADIFSFLRSDTPTGPPSTFTVSSESVSGYDSGYTDSLSGRSESFYNFPANSPTPNYAASNYSYTQDLDMDFKRMGLPTADDHSAYGGLPSSPSVRSSSGGIPHIAHYSPQTSFSSPRGSFSDYEPAQPQHVRIGSSAASDYYPQAQVNKQYNYPAAVGVGQNTVSPMEDMQRDPKKKYPCPLCPRAFARAYNLKTHTQTHDPNRSKPYACHHKSCGRSFSRKHDLTRHLVSIHRSESMSSMVSASNRAIGVDKGPRAWCDNCGKSWIGKGKDKDCECECDKVK
ncbi:hypothetical protein IEO21_03359 [Rhodonia placenta]|uniref:C2H2-type domain-containing protein n=1 Tax=Rhodonia placenta TaxID=104341 RepID=A0A8H7U492_9APHY|nr:hypothetical protein IEO21_03359 [Postia placenta]